MNPPPPTSFNECPVCYKKAIAYTYDGRVYCINCASK
jgi:hypothetical protein